MGLYYIKWPDDTRTLAFARNKEALFCLLDEEASPYEAQVLSLGNRPFAMDFKMAEVKGTDEDTGEEIIDLRGEEFEPYVYESSWLLLEKCLRIPDEKLKDGKVFFEGVFERIYGKLQPKED